MHSDNHRPALSQERGTDGTCTSPGIRTLSCRPKAWPRGCTTKALTGGPGRHSTCGTPRERPLRAPGSTTCQEWPRLAALQGQRGTWSPAKSGGRGMGNEAYWKEITPRKSSSQGCPNEQRMHPSDSQHQTSKMPTHTMVKN